MGSTCSPCRCKKDECKECVKPSDYALSSREDSQATAKDSCPGCGAMFTDSTAFCMKCESKQGHPRRSQGDSMRKYISICRTGRKSASATKKKPAKSSGSHVHFGETEDIPLVTRVSVDEDRTSIEIEFTSCKLCGEDFVGASYQCSRCDEFMVCRPCWSDEKCWTPHGFLIPLPDDQLLLALADGYLDCPHNKSHYSYVEDEAAITGKDSVDGRLQEAEQNKADTK